MEKACFFLKQVRQGPLRLQEKQNRSKKAWPKYEANWDSTGVWLALKQRVPFQQDKNGSRTVILE